MRYTKDGLSVNKTEREAQLSQEIRRLMSQGEIIESEESIPSIGSLEEKIQHDVSQPDYYL